MFPNPPLRAETEDEEDHERRIDADAEPGNVCDDDCGVDVVETNIWPPLMGEP